MPEPFFPGRGPDRIGLAVFVTAGDPPLPELADLAVVLDEAGVDCLELAVPFPGSVTDGPVIRRSADRALARGVGLAETLAFVAAVRPRLRRLRIAVLVDWSHALRRGPSLDDAAARIAGSGADGLLVHGLPPRLRPALYAATAAAALPIVTTCYPHTPSDVRADAAAHASAYLYLVAHYGRSGTAPPAGYSGLATTVTELRAACAAPVAVGFGIRTRADVERVAAAGADAAIVGSAVVAAVETASNSGHSVVDGVHDLVQSIVPLPTTRS